MNNFERLFVYGIFLAEHNRQEYAMFNARHDVVEGYATFHIGQGIVQAMPVSNSEAALTGLVVDLPPDYDWTGLDALERGYDRIIINTVLGRQAYMYVAKEDINK